MPGISNARSLTLANPSLANLGGGTFDVEDKGTSTKKGARAKK